MSKGQCWTQFCTGGCEEWTWGTCSRSRIFLPWIWRRYVPPKRRFTQDLHGATSQKTAFFIVTSVKTPNLVFRTLVTNRIGKRISELFINIRFVLSSFLQQTSVIGTLLHPHVVRRPYLQFWYVLSFLFSEPQGWDATDVFLPWDWVTASHDLPLQSSFSLLSCHFTTASLTDFTNRHPEWGVAGCRGGKPTESSSEGAPFASSEIYRGFPRSRQANTVVISRLGHDHFLAKHSLNRF
jgi:hypothetical protein